jgi:iron complex transport system substrate-binding protein
MVARAILGVLLAFVLNAQPHRIVSTFPSITETLFAIGVGDRVVGVSDFCRYPPEVLALPKIGTYTKPDAEKIALLRPDMVVIRKSAAGLADRLSALGIPHAEVTIGSLADVYSMIHTIGAAAGAAERAEKLDAQIRSKLEAIRGETRGAARPTALIIVGRTPGALTNLVAAGPSTYLGELLEIAGGKNGLTDSAIAYPRISLETILRSDPDLIVDLAGMSDPTARAEQAKEPWLAHRELKAAKNGRIFAIASEPLTTPGPRVVESVEMLRTMIRRESRP